MVSTIRQDIEWVPTCHLTDSSRQRGTVRLLPCHRMGSKSPQECKLLELPALSGNKMFPVGREYMHSFLQHVAHRYTILQDRALAQTTR